MELRDPLSRVFRRVRGFLRRLAAHAHYMRRPCREFLPLLVTMALLVILGGYSFWRLDPETSTFARGLYITYCLLFMEHVTEQIPEHWVLRGFYFFLPLVGLVVILDGIVRFSYHVLRRDETGKEWVSSVARTMSEHVILCGLGKMGLRVLQQLLELGESVVVLEKDPGCPNLAFARRHKVPVLVGNSRDEGIFAELNAAGAKSIICATDDDLANLEMALDARQLNPSIRVVLRMFDQELASKVRDAFDIQLAFSTTTLAAPLFATSSTDPSVVNSFYVDGRLLVVARLTVREGSRLEGLEVREVGAREQVFFLIHRRGEESRFYPPGDTCLEAGDEVTVQAEPQTVRLLHGWNAPGAADLGLPAARGGQRA